MKAIPENVMALIASGDTAALGTLYDCYAGLVLTLARRVLHDPVVADDLAEEIFVELWRRADRYDSTRGHLATYITTLTRSRAIDRLRIIRRTTCVQLECVTDPTATASDPTDGMVLNERSRLVTLALAVLTDNQRIVIGLAYYDGLSHVEIADHLKRPLGTVKTWIRQGLLRLRDELRTKIDVEIGTTPRSNAQKTTTCEAIGSFSI